MTDLSGKRVIVVGLGASGVAAARLCARRGASVVANDGRPRSAMSAEALALEGQGIAILAGDHASARMADADLVVVSPGVPPLPEIAAAERAGVPIWGEVELAFRSMTHSSPVIAIGGTNGKSTTTALVGAFLSANGMNAFVGGNFGEPLANHDSERFDAIVLEVSSFQMERVDTFRPHVSALLNVTEDHLDRYPNFDQYARAKGNAFARQTGEDWAIVPHADATCLAQARRGGARALTFGPGGDIDVNLENVTDGRTGERFARSSMSLGGGHNAANVAAAIACVGPFRVSGDTIRQVLRTFPGLPHRTALVADFASVRFYDDSKGTNVGASVTALEGLVESRAVLIAGGRDKGGTYQPLVDALARKGRGAVLIGEAADAIAHAIGDRVPVQRAATMDDAVRMSFELAIPGDAVLLSPACSSFDMFRDYKDRGDQFVHAVQALVRRAAQ